MYTTAENIRHSNVAGTFYPSDARRLRATVMALLREATVSGLMPRAMIVPHSGYAYSGSVAAGGYALLKPMHRAIDRVVLLGPSHYKVFRGIAATTARAFDTPLGEVMVDTKGIRRALRLPQVHRDDEAYDREHCIEVQLPFLQVVLHEFQILPFIVGHSSEEEVASLLEQCWGGDDTLVIVSSDLSHDLDYWAARRKDSETSHLIERFHTKEITPERACGCDAIRGMLRVAKMRKLRIKTVSLRNSGDTTISKERVVGYGTIIAY
jgi:AmmeMemoRadiSam system protein B